MSVASLSSPWPRLAVPEAWKRVGRREVLYAAAFGVAGVAYFIILDVPSEVFHEYASAKMWRYLATALFAYEVLAFCMMLALVLADDAVDRGAPRIAAYAAAIVGGCLVGIAIGTLCQAAFFTWWDDILRKRGWAFVLRVTWRTVARDAARWLPICLGIGFLYAEVRRIRRTQAQLREAELTRAKRARAAFEARLAAMQARVEPGFLFDTLTRVRELYRTSAARADATLDDLIDYLRAAMPRMRDTSSTVAQEFELARAYLTIVAPSAWEIGVADDANPSRMPPMVLLPLVDCAIAGGLAEGPEPKIRLAATPEGATLRIRASVRGDAFARGTADERMRVLRDRLAALYGNSGRLTLQRRDAEWTEAVVELPFEGAEREVR